jgi:hypothetical protein
MKQSPLATQIIKYNDTSSNILNLLPMTKGKVAVLLSGRGSTNYSLTQEANPVCLSLNMIHRLNLMDERHEKR